MCIPYKFWLEKMKMMLSRLPVAATANRRSIVAAVSKYSNGECLFQNISSHQQLSERKVHCVVAARPPPVTHCVRSKTHQQKQHPTLSLLLSSPETTRRSFADNAAAPAKKPSKTPIKQLYFGNMDESVTEDDLKQHCIDAGGCTADQIKEIVIPRTSNKTSRGFGFITFDTAATAAGAKTKLHSTKLKSNSLTVSTVSQHNSSILKGYTLIVSNLHVDTTWQILKDHMKTCGLVRTVFVYGDAAGTSSHNFAVVQYLHEASRTKALTELNNSNVLNSSISLRIPEF